MQYFYATMWLVVGLILIFSISKENKIFYFAGGYFIFLGAWWLIDAVNSNVDMFSGSYGVALKIVTFIALAVLAGYYIKQYIKGKKNEKNSGEEK